MEIPCGDFGSQGTSSLASMGPCSVEHGNADGRRVRHHGSVCFNGAMLRRAWKFNWLIERSTVSMSFNGAMLRRAWKYDDVAIGGHWVNASMGPCSVEHGNPRVVDVSTRCSPSFNGAMLRRAWKSLGLEYVIRRYGSFNGAMLRRAWKYSVMVVCVLVKRSRFNGAMLRRAWKCTAMGLCGDYKRASMGPCSVEHGNLAEDAAKIREEFASMGPCSVEHGNSKAVEATKDTSEQASMGPCSVEHGNCGSVDLGIIGYNASMGPCSVEHGNLVNPQPIDKLPKLQWGHAP